MTTPEKQVAPMIQGEDLYTNLQMNHVCGGCSQSPTRSKNYFIRALPINSQSVYGYSNNTNYSWDV